MNNPDKLPKLMPAAVLMILFLFPVYLSAQPDSLQKAIDAATDPDKKLALLLKQADGLKNSNPPASFVAAQEASRLINPKKDPRLLAEAEFLMALYYLKSDKWDSVLHFTRKNILSLTKSGDKSLLLVNFNNLEGGYYMHGQRHREALQRYYSSLAIADETGDALSKIKAIANIGWAYMELNLFDTAIVRFKQAITLMKANNLDIFAAVYNNTASCYGDLKKYDSAKKFVLTGIEIARKNNDPISLANGLNILGTVYQSNQQYEEALNVLLEARKIREKTGDPFFIVSDLATIAELYAKTGKPELGLEAGNKALKMAVENSITAKLPMIYLSLANNYEAAGNFPAAMEMYKRVNVLKDSLYVDASPQALAEMKTLYETEKQERRIQDQQNRISQQNLMITGSIVLLVLGILLAFTHYRRSKWKQEAKMKTAVMVQQEIAARAVIEAEEAERQRIAKDLHDGVGQMMSAARMNLSAFEEAATFRSKTEKQDFDRIVGLVDESCREVRAVSHNMMPNALLKQGLASAIREFIHKLDQKKIRVQLYTEGLEERLDSNLETVLYRVIQECVNNVIRHADASTVDISVVRENDIIRGTIEDNGKGFDTQNHEEGLGLKNIRTRIDYLKGTVEVDSAPGKGTLVAFHVPLN
jgi:two-component system NarL family sensor kinase